MRERAVWDVACLRRTECSPGASACATAQPSWRSGIPVQVVKWCNSPITAIGACHNPFCQPVQLSSRVTPSDHPPSF
jgi:hypothetical protein